MVERIKPSDESIVKACDVKAAYPSHYPSKPLPVGNVARAAAIIEAPKGTDYPPLNLISTSYVKRRLDALVAEGRLLSGDWRRMGLARESRRGVTYYGTPALVRANRTRTLSGKRDVLAAEAKRKATATLIARYRPEFDALVAANYVDPVGDYPIDPS